MNWMILSHLSKRITGGKIPDTTEYLRKKLRMTLIIMADYLKIWLVYSDEFSHLRILNARQFVFHDTIREDHKNFRWYIKLLVEKLDYTIELFVLQLIDALLKYAVRHFWISMRVFLYAPNPPSDDGNPWFLSRTDEW